MQTYHETVAYLQDRIGNFIPEFGIILGTGLGALVNDLVIYDSIPYEEIPYFPVSTVESHSGKLIIGELGDRKVIVMQGRFHYYEGYTMLMGKADEYFNQLAGKLSLSAEEKQRAQDAFNEEVIPWSKWFTRCA